MANANRPAGLIPVKYLNGARWNEQTNIYYIAQSDTNAYAVGDPLTTAVGHADSNGVSAVTLATAGTGNAIRGVLVGLGTNESMMGNPMNPGGILIPAVKSTAYYVMVVDDPNVIFEIQANDNHYSSADIGNNCNLLAGASNGYVSGWQINDGVASTPFASADQLRLLGVTRRMGNTLGQSNTAFLVLINKHELGGVAAGVSFSLDPNGNPVGLQTPNAGLYNISLFPSGDTSGAKDTANFNAVIGLLNTAGFGRLTVQAGNFYVLGSQVTPVTASCTIEGLGAGVWRRTIQTTGVIYTQGVTTVNNIEAGSPLFTFLGSSIKLTNIRLKCTAATPVFNTTGIGSCGVLQTFTSGASDSGSGLSNIYDNVSFEGFYTGLDIRCGGEWKITGCHFTNNTWVSLRINNLLNNDMGDWLVDGNWFYPTNGFACILWESSDGGMIINNKMNGPSTSTSGTTWQYGIYITGFLVGSVPLVGAGNNVLGNTTVAPNLGGSAPVNIGQIRGNSIESVGNSHIVINSQQITNGANANALLKIMENEFGAVVSSGLGCVGISNQGSGYGVGNVLSLVGGTYSTQATATVTSIDGTGKITGILLTNVGAYTVWPTAPAGNGTGIARIVPVTGGAGTGAMLIAYPNACVIANGCDGLEINSNSHAGNNNGYMIGPYCSNVNIGTSSFASGLVDGVSGAPFTVAAEMVAEGPFDLGQVTLAQGNQVLFVSLSDNIQNNNTILGGNREFKYKRYCYNLNQNANVPFFTVGLANNNPTFVDVWVNGNVDYLGPVSAKISLIIASQGGNSNPLAITVASSSGTVNAVASTLTPTIVLNGTSLFAFSATNGAYTGGPEITLKSVLGSAPWIQSKMEIGLTNVANNAACVFHGYFGLEVRGGCALFALGQTNT
jgi:hypothetical protein